MRVVVTAIGEGASPMVKLDSDIGSFWAEWRGQPPPELGTTDVEVDTNDELQWSVDIERDPGAAHRIETTNGDTIVTGTVDGLLGVDLVSLTVGPTILWLDVDGDLPLGIVGTTVTARLRSVFVVPENY